MTEERRGRTRSSRRHDGSWGADSNSYAEPLQAPKRARAPREERAWPPRAEPGPRAPFVWVVRPRPSRRKSARRRQGASRFGLADPASAIGERDTSGRTLRFERASRPNCLFGDESQMPIVPVACSPRKGLETRSERHIRKAFVARCTHDRKLHLHAPRIGLSRARSERDMSNGASRLDSSESRDGTGLAERVA